MNAASDSLAQVRADTVKAVAVMAGRSALPDTPTSPQRAEA
jgi:hypothetical protein